jgi:hypothetical protein
LKKTGSFIEDLSEVSGLLEQLLEVHSVLVKHHASHLTGLNITDFLSDEGINSIPDHLFSLFRSSDGGKNVKVDHR